MRNPAHRAGNGGRIPQPPRVDEGEPLPPLRPRAGADLPPLREIGPEFRKSVGEVGNQLRSVPVQLADNLKALVDAISELIAQHIKLARVELKEDATALGVQVGKMAAFAPLLIFGYLFLCIAGALFLARYVPVDAAFLIVAGVNLVAGAVGILLAVRGLKQRKLMARTKDELQSTALAFRSTRT